MSIVFFGTSGFATPALEKLSESGFKPALIITTPDAPVGRKQILTPPPVKVKADELGFEVYQPASLKKDEAVERIKRVGAEVGVLAAYGKIIPRTVLDIFPKGILNIHPSLLPKWRGPTPIQSTILAGDKETGVSIILLDAEMDHGSILTQREFSISNFQFPITYTELSKYLASVGSEMIIDVLPKWLKGKIEPRPQDHNQATFSKKFSREDARIDWTKSAEEIDRMIRALNPEPGTWTTFVIKNEKLQTTKKQTIKILVASLLPNYSEAATKKTGEIFLTNDKNVAVKSGQDALVLETVQPESKKSMSAADFLRGHRDLTELILN